jgi:hypothetical protein
MDVDAMFHYVLSLIDTSSEIKKDRHALSNVKRKVSEPVNQFSSFYDES